MAGQLILVRHAQTPWSVAGRLTGTTDVPLTEHGESQAKVVGDALAGRRWQLVLVSPMSRTRRTAELLGAGDYEVCDDLRPWDYGTDEGAVTAELMAARPGWSLFGAGPLGGERPRAVARRVDRAIIRCQESLGSRDVLLVGHSHVLQLFAARWLGLAPRFGDGFDLDTAATATLAVTFGIPRILRWNVPPDPEP